MLRSLNDADLPEAAELIVRSWARAYVDLVPPELQPSAEEHLDQLRAPGSVVWGAEVEGVIVGVAQVLDDELAAFHVDPHAQGAGIGSALHDHVLHALKASALTMAHLWVFEANEHARAFYAQRGWTMSGSADDAPERCAAAPVVRMERSL